MPTPMKASELPPVPRYPCHTIYIGRTISGEWALVTVRSFYESQDVPVLRAMADWLEVANGITPAPVVTDNGCNCSHCGHYETNTARANERYAHCPSCGRHTRWNEAPVTPAPVVSEADLALKNELAIAKFDRDDLRLALERLLDVIDDYPVSLADRHLLTTISLARDTLARRRAEGK